MYLFKLIKMNKSNDIEILPDNVDEAFTMRNTNEQRFYHTYSDALKISRNQVNVISSYLDRYASYRPIQSS